MRIISGKYRGRKFFPAKHFPTRPTTDFAKEGLFNILTNVVDFEQVRFLDLFCGTGSISYEFASRGCEDITVVDKYPGCIKFVDQTAQKLGITGLKSYNQDVLKFIADCYEQYDIIFAGPPYAFPHIDRLPDLIFEKELLTPQGWFILEHSPKDSFDEHPRFHLKRNYGTTIFSIFTC